MCNLHAKKLWWQFPVAIGMSILLLPACSMAFMLDFTFEPGVPADLQTAVNYAGGLWESWLLDTASGESEDVEIKIDYRDLGANVLGEAGPTYVWYDDDYAYLPSIGAILYGADDTDNMDGVINFSNRFTWYYGTDGNPGASQYDAVTVAVHEIGHQVGFYDSYEASTNNKWGYNITGTYRLMHYDTFLRDEDGDAPVAGGGDSFNETDNPVYFVGTNAKLANGGDDIPIYAPSSYSPGSSLSHLDVQEPFSNYMMAPLYHEVCHDLSDVEIGILRDLGWQAVPEPATVVLLGLSSLIFVLRRRR